MKIKTNPISRYKRNGSVQRVKVEESTGHKKVKITVTLLNLERQMGRCSDLRKMDYFLKKNKKNMFSNEMNFNETFL